MPNPKFKLGQKVWRIDGGKLVEEEITSMHVPARKLSLYNKTVGDQVFYGFSLHEHYESFRATHSEDTVFATKEELIASL